jgi:hypothetical protein
MTFQQIFRFFLIIIFFLSSLFAEEGSGKEGSEGSAGGDGGGIEIAIAEEEDGLDSVKRDLLDIISIYEKNILSAAKNWKRQGSTATALRFQMLNAAGESAAISMKFDMSCDQESRKSLLDISGDAGHMQLFFEGETLIFFLPDFSMYAQANITDIAKMLPFNIMAGSPAPLDLKKSHVAPDGAATGMTFKNSDSKSMNKGQIEEKLKLFFKKLSDAVKEDHVPFEKKEEQQFNEIMCFPYMMKKNNAETWFYVSKKEKLFQGVEVKNKINNDHFRVVFQHNLEGLPTLFKGMITSKQNGNADFNMKIAYENSSPEKMDFRFNMKSLQGIQMQFQLRSRVDNKAPIKVEDLEFHENEDMVKVLPEKLLKNFSMGMLPKIMQFQNLMMPPVDPGMDGTNNGGMGSGF